MDNDNRILPEQNASVDEKNQQYVFVDSLGVKHVLTAGEDGVTQQWIALIRLDESKEGNSNYRYYFKWNGKEHRQRVFSSDVVPLEELENFPSMTTSEDALALLIAREERETFLLKFHEAMQSLTAKQKQLIHQKVNLKMTNVEIARQEGVSGMAIHYRWENLRKKLKKYFD